MTVFKIEIISQSVRVKMVRILLFFFLRKIRNAVSILAVLLACNFLLYPAAWMQI